MKRIAILGSTGSIGINTLKVILSFPSEFRVVGLTANSNINLLSRQVKMFSPKIAAVANGDKFRDFKDDFNGRTKIYRGREGLLRVASYPEVDLVVVAISGSSALLPLLAAIDSGKTIALANKEALVMAGRVIIERARQKKVKIIPIDSEQSAIWQCLENRNRKELRRIYLTASGGPLNNVPKERFSKLSIEAILTHPRWKMGKKISVDSATMVNKGLEIIEAKWLFGVDISQIKVIIHPEAIIHSMVEFIDGVILAQLAATDMRLPIQYALSYPKRWQAPVESLDFLKLKGLTFQKPDEVRFPCLRLAFKAAKDGGSAPCVLNAANEEAVNAFLDKRLNFVYIPKVIEKILAKHKVVSNPSLKQILELDRWARDEAISLISS